MNRVMDSPAKQFVWVFTGAGARFPAGIFATLDSGEAWIAKHGLSGMLTKYPVGSGAYDWSIETGSFRVTRAEHSKPDFIASFGCAAFEHHHYEDGEPA